jgi:hypothetical protein
VKGLDKVIKDIARRYDPKEAGRRVTQALYEAAKAVAVPAIQSQVQSTTHGAEGEPSPWRRGRQVKNPGPMAKRVRVKKLKPRINEYGAVHIGINTSTSSAVIRGTKEHDIKTSTGQTYHHPGAKSNNLLGNAMKGGTEKAMVDMAAQLITRD